MTEFVILNGFSNLLIIPALAILVVFFAGVIGFVRWIHSTAKRRGHANPARFTILVFAGISAWIVFLSVVFDFVFGVVLTIFLIVIGFFGWIIYRGVVVVWRSI